jgi:putative aminopeptidase FrvX
MPSLPSIDSEYLQTVLVGLLNTPSPAGLAESAIAYTEARVTELRLSPIRTPKGGLLATIAGRKAEQPRALTSHVDTLGAMVKEIKPSGRLRLSPIGHFAWNVVEGEGCWIFAEGRTPVRGSLLLTQASGHIFGAEVGKEQRTDETLEVRLDERTTSAADTHGLGIAVGDFVAFDPRVEVSQAGYIRSRYLDDKAGAACVLAAAHALASAGRQPSRTTTLHFSNYEEVGHGASSGLPDGLAELVAVDMAPVGEGQASDEFHVTLCAMDSGGPYHVELTHHLKTLARTHNIPFVTDLYPHYQSDGEAFWIAGGDVRVALLGPGIDASHNYERTHIDGLLATTNLILAYLLD